MNFFLEDAARSEVFFDIFFFSLRPHPNPQSGFWRKMAISKNGHFPPFGTKSILEGAECLAPPQFFYVQGQVFHFRPTRKIFFWSEDFSSTQLHSKILVLSPFFKFRPSKWAGCGFRSASKFFPEKHLMGSYHPPYYRVRTTYFKK